jgi:signal transduction histidine kinase
MRPIPDRRALAGAGLVLVLAAAAAWVGAQRQHDAALARSREVSAAAERLLAQQATSLAAAADLVSGEIADGAAITAAEPPFQQRARVDRSFRVTAGSGLSADLLADPAVRAAAALAADTGDPYATTGGTAGSAVTVVAWPVYARGGLLGTEQRRAALGGWVLATLPVAAVVDPVRAPLVGLDEGLRVRGPAATSAGPVDLVVRASYRPVAGASGSGLALPLSLAGLVLGVGLALVALVTRQARLRREHESHVRDHRRQMALLADLGATAQSGLDVSLTLPAVLTQLQTGLGLNHLVVRAGAAGTGGELLALGSHPEAGTTVSFPLHRALRTVGVLEVTSRHELSIEHQQVLQAAADIIAGFLHNTELFEREQLAVARLQSLDRLKDDFLGTVSHELRTPLAIIMGFLSMLRSRWRIMSDEERTGAFTTIGNHATALTALVNDLLDFVTDRRGADQLQVAPVQLAASVEEIVERFRPMFAQHSLELALDETTTVSTDPRAVERIVTNLLSNAVKYSPQESVIEVRVGHVSDGGAVVVQDHGPGIAREDRELVFERFYRGSTDAARGTRGTGIGLTIVKTWLELVGARLEVRSAPGSGTEMTVVFPAAEGTALEEAGQIVWRELAGSTTGRAS